MATEFVSSRSDGWELVINEWHKENDSRQARRTFGPLQRQLTTHLPG